MIKENISLFDFKSLEHLESLKRTDSVEYYKVLKKLLHEDKLMGLHLIDSELSNVARTSRSEKTSIAGKPNFYDEIIEDIEKISDSVQSYLYKKTDIKLGIVCDEFIYHSYKDTCNLIYVDKDMNGFDDSLDALVLVSTWKGLDGSWKNVANPNSEKRQVLYELAKKSKAEGVPLIFYSKEDPVNYDRFIDIAAQCDFVFTSANEIIPRYIEDCGHENIYPLQFGVNPFYHNPVGRDNSNLEEVIFAGSWNERYPERNSEISTIFDGVIDAGKDLTIIDRNLPMQNERYQFPLKYASYVTSPLGHTELMKVHKLFPWNININTIKYSETMFANRVYELQALGGLMLSNYSAGVNNLFPYINLIHDRKDVETIMNNQRWEAVKELQMKSIRNVMLTHTTFHRLQNMMEKIGKKVDLELPRVIIINEHGEGTDDMFNKQSYPHFDLMNSMPKDISSYDFIFEASSKYYYEENFIETLVSTFAYTDTDFVTMNDDSSYHTTSLPVPGLTLYKAAKYNQDSSAGFKIPLVEVQNNGSFKNVEAEEKKLSVIIPIHNNGKYLEDKCFNSLKRQSIFKEMEIIFIDDGSTDISTIHTIDRLRRRHPDIKHYRFEEGSGSASRPRNKGMDLVTTEYVTYLDPDNEALGDGYSELFKELEKDRSLDMAVGNIIREDNKKRTELKYSGTLNKFNNGKSIIENPIQFLKDSGLKTQSIQALIVKSDIIRKNNLKMVEGAAGQDSIFFQELMLNSSKVKVLRIFIHVYYAFVSGSVTNTVTRRFFEKYHKLEQYRIPFLKKNNLFDTYVNERFDFYFENWYLKRLPRLVEAERKPALETLLKIYELYEKEGVSGGNELREKMRSIKKEVS